jgi:dihydrofolate reductase
MRKLVFLMHISLDGFVAGTEGEMDWIRLSAEMFDFVAELTAQADAALYSRKTFEMMDAYWPGAGDQPNASKHDKEHSEWYNKVTKYVLSNSMKGRDSDKIKIINGDVKSSVNDIKQQPGANIMCFGSPSAIHALLPLGLIDEFYLMVNPVLLGKGIPLFKNISQRMPLRFISSKIYDGEGIVCLHYAKA